MKMNKLFILIALIAIFNHSIHAQDYDVSSDNIDSTPAYSSSSSITQLSAYIPVVTLILAALVLSRADKRARGRQHYYDNSCYAHQGYDNSYHPSFSSGYSSGTGSYNSRSYSGFHSH